MSEKTEQAPEQDYRMTVERAEEVLQAAEVVRDAYRSRFGLDFPVDAVRAEDGRLVQLRIGLTPELTLGLLDMLYAKLAVTQQVAGSIRAAQDAAEEPEVVH